MAFDLAVTPRKRVFIFDLDNTLHDASAHVFPLINTAMTRYLREHLAIEHEEANRLRDHYWRKYGATLRGLMRHHGTDPHHFLRETHRFDDLESLLVASPLLLRALRALQRRKLIFSNAPSHYVSAVLCGLQIRHLFEVVHCIEHANFRPKPQLHGFRRLLARARLNPYVCIFVDDSLQNLQTAKRLGMQTILVGANVRAKAYVDHHAKNPRQLAGLLRCLG